MLTISQVRPLRAPVQSESRPHALVQLPLMHQSLAQSVFWLHEEPSLAVPLPRLG